MYTACKENGLGQARPVLAIEHILGASDSTLGGVRCQLDISVCSACMIPSRMLTMYSDSSAGSNQRQLEANEPARVAGGNTMALVIRPGHISMAHLSYGKHWQHMHEPIPAVYG